MPEEREYFNAGGVVVTTKRIVTPGQTFAISGVTSVRYEFERGKRSLPTLVILLGVLLLTIGVSGDSLGIASLITGVALVVFGVVGWRDRQGSHVVLIGTSGGERPALKSSDESFIRGIVAAVNRSIAEQP